MRRQQGYTIVELIAAIAITMILAAGLIGFMITWLQGYSASAVRASLTTDSRKALSMLSDDIRATSNAVDYNQWPDINAPSTPATMLGSSPADTDRAYYWRSYEHSLILLRPARNSSGAPIYDDAVNFTGKKDNYVYFVDTTTMTLYRRTIPVPQSVYANNTEVLKSCSPQRDVGGCPDGDIKLTGNVAKNADGTPAFTISYYNDIGTPVIGATSVRAIVITLTLSSTQAGTPVNVTNSLRMEFRNN